MHKNVNNIEINKFKYNNTQNKSGKIHNSNLIVEKVQMKYTLKFE